MSIYDIVDLSRRMMDLKGKLNEVDTAIMDFIALLKYLKMETEWIEQVYEKYQALRSDVMKEVIAAFRRVVNTPIEID